MKRERIKALFILLVALLAFNGIKASSINISNAGDQYHPTAEKMPSPIGGLPAIYKKISYPEIARKAGIQGKVYVMALVNENGGVDDVKVLKGIGGGCDEAAVEAVKATKFTPGQIKGKNVKVKVALPIVFRLK